MVEAKFVVLSGLLHLNLVKKKKKEFTSLFKMNFPYLGEFLHEGPLSVTRD